MSLRSMTLRTTPRRLVAALTAGAALAAGMALSLASASSTDELKHFPPSMKGYERHVLTLDARNDESGLQVELLPGQLTEVDCNHYALTTKTEARDVKGFGYTYYVVNWNGDMMGTQMGCGDAPKTAAFVKGAPTMVAYNSKLPIVVFVPKKLNMRFRIWQASEELDMESDGPAGDDAAAATVKPGKGKANTTTKGGHLSVRSTQAAGTTKVIRKKDRYGNRISFTQSD